MLYTEPKIKISKFESVQASGEIPADATASGLGYDVSVSYAEILANAAEDAKSVLNYTK